MLACVPIASMVTVQPSRAKVASNSGMAVFSLDFSPVARCPNTKPAPAAKADTRCKAVVSTPPERRLVLPSMATTSGPSTGKTLPTQRRNEAWNSSGSIIPNKRPKVSCEGMPWASTRDRRSQSSLSLAHNSISTNVSAPTKTALTATTSNSTKSCSTLAACRGSVIDTKTSANRIRPVVSMETTDHAGPHRGEYRFSYPLYFPLVPCSCDCPGESFQGVIYAHQLNITVSQCVSDLELI